MSRPRKRARRSHHDGLRGIEVPSPPAAGRRDSGAGGPDLGGEGDAPDVDLLALAVDQALLPVLHGMVWRLSDEGLVQLEAMLRDSHTSPRPSERRHQVLGLMGRLVRAGEGVIPTVADYRDAYQKAKEAGESWPEASTLIRRYGNWFAAVEASMKLEFIGTRARVKSSYAHAHVGDYTPREVGLAILRCRSAVGPWPTEAEFERFCVVERRLAAAHGKPSPRAPSAKAWGKACGTWDAACDVAKTLS